MSLRDLHGHKDVTHHPPQPHPQPRADSAKNPPSSARRPLPPNYIPISPNPHSRPTTKRGFGNRQAHNIYNAATNAGSERARCAGAAEGDYGAEWGCEGGAETGAGQSAEGGGGTVDGEESG